MSDVSPETAPVVVDPAPAEIEPTGEASPTETEVPEPDVPSADPAAGTEEAPSADPIPQPDGYGAGWKAPEPSAAAPPEPVSAPAPPDGYGIRKPGE